MIIRCLLLYRDGRKRAMSFDDTGCYESGYPTIILADNGKLFYINEAGSYDEVNTLYPNDKESVYIEYGIEAWEEL